MERPYRTGLLLLLVLAPAAALAQAQEPTLVRLRDAVGDTIDAAERDSLRLFPNTAGFDHAVILGLPGPEFYAKVARADGATVAPIYYRVLPGELQRIRFLIDYPVFVAQQQRVDSTAAQSLASFWQSVEGHPLQSMDGESAGGPVANRSQPAPPIVENRYCSAFDGMTCGSIVGGFIGSHAGIRFVRTEQDGCLFPPSSVYHVDPCVFWGASCGITALGTGVGYALGDNLDHEQAGQMTRLKEGTGWRTGFAIGALVPGLALGYVTFWTVGFTRYGVLEGMFDRIDNDPEGWTALPMAFSGLCIAIESMTIGYRIGRAIDRRNAEEAEARRRALGR
ncbi:MAG: hypothetical protein NTX53_12835 [candidate division WOR-3 bacterium]|nr:hypothetical protein [candidate division WOR-3 bacterium]